MPKEPKKNGNFIPLNGRVFIIPEPTKNKTTEGGLHLPENARADEKPEVGVILAVDTNEEHELNEHLSAGVRVLFNRFSAAEVEIKKGMKCLTINKDSIFGVYT